VLTALWARTPEQAQEIEVSLAHVDREDVGTLDTRLSLLKSSSDHGIGLPTKIRLTILAYSN
jgi:hypothetical protein